VTLATASIRGAAAPSPAVTRPPRARRFARRTQRRSSSSLKPLWPSGRAPSVVACGGRRDLALAAPRTGERLLAAAQPPRHRPDATGREPGLAHLAADDVQRGGDRHHREVERRPVADLEVARAPRERRARHPDRGDQLARQERGLAVRSVARHDVEILERHRAVAARSAQLDRGAERESARPRDPTRGSRRSARSPRRSRGGDRRRRAPRSRLPGARLLHANPGVRKYAHPRALQQVAADRRGVAQLRRRAGEQGLGDHRGSRSGSPGGPRRPPSGRARRSRPHRRAARIASSGSRATSITADGAHAASFHSASTSPPPATNTAPAGPRRARAHRARWSRGRSRTAARSGPHRVADRRDDVGVRAAPAQVAAHLCAQAGLVGGAPSPSSPTADRICPDVQ